MRRLAVVQLGPETPVARIESTDAGHDADQARERDRRRHPGHLGRDQPRPKQLPGKCGHVADRAMEPLRGPLEELRLVHPERREDELAEHLLEWTARPLPDKLAQWRRTRGSSRSVASPATPG